MDFSFENQGTNTFLVYTVLPEDCIDTLSLGMLTNNKINGLATTLFTQMDTTKYIKFNVSAKISVKQFFAGAVNKKRLLGVFTGIVDAMLSAEDYMIDSNSIILDLEYIFTDVSSCETVLICLPIITTEQNKPDIGLFFKNIMFSTQFDQTENCDHVAKIINYLNSTPVFSLIDFKKILDEIKVTVGETAQPIVKQKTLAPVSSSSQMSGQAQYQPQAQSQPVARQTSSSVPKQNPTQQVTVPGNSAGTNNNIPIQSPANVPNIPRPQQATPQQVVNQTHGEKEMSMFGLLMHYNKENAAKYKAQKAAKKNNGVQVQVANYPSTPNIPKSQMPNTVPRAQVSNVGFAIPGQPTPPPMATQPQQTIKSGGQKPVYTSTQPSPQASSAAQQQAYKPSAVPQGGAMNFGETTVLGGGKIGETTVLNGVQPGQTIMPRLIRAKNSETIDLNKPVFRIGKEKSYVDYFISDNTAISRSHANVISRDGKYYVVDTNSTNHTFVDGKMIQSNTEVEITHGTRIRLANEDFELKLY